MPSTLREMRRHLANPRAVVAMVVVALVLGLAGPFGTYASLPLAGRMAYWVGTVFLTYALGYGLSIAADIAWGRGRPFLVRMAVMALPAGIGATAVVTLLNLAVFGLASFGLGQTAVLLAECLAVAAAVVAMVLLFDPGRREVSEPPAPRTILERLPLPQRGRLLALSVEDHYVDVITDRGKTLLLMRLSDAIGEAGVEGLQVHRSHWVARDAVVQSRRSEGRLVLELSNGLELPVSRRYLPQVRAAGLG